ncbi:MAG: dicarboxylate/amino acid:cation symporter [Nitrosopumilus sp.]|nr:dicarboxylate/amino acid:cation symporter [Nitrosopumilus sp.]
MLLLSVDRILDMIRTMVNVTGDLTACCVFHKITQNKSVEKK